MGDAGATGDLRFEPPGPGSWRARSRALPPPGDALLGRDPSRARSAAAPVTSCATTGCCSTGSRARYVNGFAYNQPMPVADEEIPQRFAARRGGASRRSSGASSCASGTRRQAGRDREAPRAPGRRSRRAHRRRAGRLPHALCRDHHAAMITQHMRFTAGAMIPTGDFLAHVGDWTGLSHAELLGLMRGAAPVSAGGSDELERAHHGDHAGPGRDGSCSSPTTIPRRCSPRCARSPATPGQRCSGYLDLVGQPAARRLRHLRSRARSSCPTRCSRAIRIAVSAGVTGEGADVEAEIADVRDQVPEEHRAEFDELLGEARLMYRLRDERGVYSDIWASGLMRRAALGGRSAGRRPGSHRRPRALRRREPRRDVRVRHRRGRPVRRRARGARRVPAPRTPPRTRRRSSATRRTRRPTRRGSRPAPRRADARDRASRWARSSGARRPSTSEDTLRGLAASPGVYEGPARLIAGPPSSTGSQQGDVLVTPATTEAFNILLPLLGAIVTDSGGLLSHSAIVAREYGIPGVVGTRDATERIADGTRRARRRHRGRSHGPRVSRRRPARRGARHRRSSARRRSGSATRSGTVSRSRPASRSPARSSRRSPSEDEQRRSRGSRRRSRTLPAPLAVRSSAVDEDGAGRQLRRPAPHAAQRAVGRRRAVPRCGEIWWSANSDSAITYRQRVGLFTRPSVGVVVQSLLDPDAAGVMFTENPVTGADERVIEASWGLGEAVVAGLVIPDTFRVDRTGDGARAHAGAQADRDPLARRTAARSRRRCRRSRREQLCLDDDQLAELHELAHRCDAGLRQRRATSSGRSPTAPCTCCSAAPSRRARRAPGARAGGRRRRPGRSAARHVPLFAGLDRRTRSSRSRALFKERRSRPARP